MDRIPPQQLEVLVKQGHHERRPARPAACVVHEPQVTGLTGAQFEKLIFAPRHHPPAEDRRAVRFRDADGVRFRRVARRRTPRLGDTGDDREQPFVRRIRQRRHAPDRCAERADRKRKEGPIPHDWCPFLFAWMTPRRSAAARVRKKNQNCAAEMPTAAGVKKSGFAPVRESWRPVRSLGGKRSNRLVAMRPEKPPPEPAPSRRAGTCGVRIGPGALPRRIDAVARNVR